MRRTLLALIISGALAGCGGGGGGATVSRPPAKAPGIAGLQRAVDAARGAVSASQADARRAAATDAGQ
jgi:hypothetical protein